MRTTLSGIAVIDGTTGTYVADFSKFTAPTQAWAAILLLQPVVADVSGSQVDTGTANIIVSGNLGASCDQDPTEDAFDDSQIADGARLVLVTWPTGNTALTLPAPTPAANWRNRLVYTIFMAESTLDADDYLPWEFFGVPLALTAFDATAKLQFADRSAVVRTGGMPRRRYLRPYGSNIAVLQPALANARVNQLAEQLGEDLTPSTPPGTVLNEFAYLPPAGILPIFTMDLANKKALWCPSNWTVSAAPVFSEELEGAIQTAMTAAPLETAQNETIEILVPLPDAVYDPNILVAESPGPEFQAEVDAATLALNIVLQHRYTIQEEANVLAPLLNLPETDTNAGLTSTEVAELTATPAVFSPLASEAFGTTSSDSGYLSNDLQQLTQTGAAPPYTVSANGTQIPLFSLDDWNDLKNNGIQHFIDRINAKLDKANDLLDLAFLTVQTDIYRYRQNVLNTTDASRLAVSPILANIAAGDTAAATAQNIRTYLDSIQSATTTDSTTTTPPPTTTTPKPGTTLLIFKNFNPVAAPTFLNTQKIAVSQKTPVTEQFTQQVTSQSTQQFTEQTVASKTATTLASSEVQKVTQSNISPIDIAQQSPIVGAQLNLRTLTIAERLAPPPAQEAMYYSVGNRVAVLQLLADLEITIDDLPVLVDNLPSGTTPFIVADLRSSADATRNAQLYQLVNTPAVSTPAQLGSNPDVSALFSTGIHVLEQNTQLLRAVEARIQQYQDFLALAATALTNVQDNMAGAQSLLAQLNNDLTQARQNLAFVQSLFADEQARVANVNAQRASILQQYVTFIGYIRRRTVILDAPVTARQLVPASVANPVPACLKQITAVPPELTEIIGLLRETPVVWFPPIIKQLPNLERPSLLQDLATSTQARASLQLQMSPMTSSAESAGGVFASTISNIFTANQKTVRTLQTARAAFNPATLSTQSWSAQVTAVSGIAAIGDLLSAASVHPQISNATSRSLQQIASVATCLYTRVGQTLPVDRLQWANFLNNGMVNLQNLAILPGWNTQDYTDRQQMQELVDWLFQQVDTNNASAVSLMNDVVATAILLASSAPVDDIIAGAVASRVTPVIGNVIRLTLPSDRIAHGMSVQLYSGGDLAARAVVSDLDGSGVNATVTDIYKPNVALQANDVAHFTALDQNAVVYRAFSV
jgi:hypothetical protein